jgi:DNA-binding NarL/FixJ family response regulator
VLVYCCSDLIFATRISAMAADLDVPARPARSSGMLQARLDRVADGKANDPVGAVLVDMDLGDQAIELIRCAKAADDPPWACAFGSHVARDLLQAASDAGADLVLPRSAFVNSLASIIREHAPTSEIKLDARVEDAPADD